MKVSSRAVFPTCFVNIHYAFVDCGEYHKYKCSLCQISGALLIKGDGWVDEGRLISTLTEEAVRLGVTHVPEAEITKTDQRADGTWLVTTDKGDTFSSVHFVNAAGACLLFWGGFLSADTSAVVWFFALANLHSDFLNNCQLCSM